MADEPEAALNADEVAPDMLLRCPRCGLVSAGLRCERCNAAKITQCSGACSMCGISKCVAPKKREQSGL